MNFEGWKIGILFEQEFYDKFRQTDNVSDTTIQLQKLAEGYRPTLKRLIFDCNYMPKRGDFISGRENCDGAYISSVLFQEFPDPPEIVFILTEKEPTN